MSQPIEGIFFDLDGTLMDTAPDFIALCHAMQDEYGSERLSGDSIREAVAIGSLELARRAFPEGSDEQLKAAQMDFLARYEQRVHDDNRTERAVLYPDAARLLDLLDEKGIAWGVVTNKPRTYAAPILQLAGLLDRCSALICPEDVDQAKPSPEGLLLACEQSKVMPHRCLYAGDHDRDIIAGQKAGMLTVAAHYGYIIADTDPHQWQADINVHNFTQLIELLEWHRWSLPLSAS